MNDIFKDMQANVGCEYISDLPSYKRKVWHEMKRLNPADYEERQLEDFSKSRNVYIVVDMELKGLIREALIKMILGFDIALEIEEE